MATSWSGVTADDRATAAAKGLPVNRAATVLLVALAGVQLIDVVVHLATSQVEVLRIIASAVIVMAAVVARAVPVGSAGITVIVVGAAIYLVLNVVFLVDAGLVNSVTGAPRILLFVFIALTLIAATALMVVRRRAPR